MKKTSTRILISVLSILCLLPIIVNQSERAGSIGQARIESTGKIIELRNGFVHYRDVGSSTSQCTVLVHGASGPLDVWENIIPLLARDDRRIIAYDLYGRGLSDRPKLVYNQTLYSEQLSNLVRALDCVGPLNLIGSSMGAIIVADYTVSYTEEVHKVAIIGPAGFPIEASPASNFLQFPFVGEYVISIMGKRFLTKHNAKYYNNSDAWPKAKTDYNMQFNFSGYKRALLSTMREMPMLNNQGNYEALGMSGVEIILIWGRDDKTFPYEHFEAAKEFLRPKTSYTVKNAAHVPQYEQAIDVAFALNNFLDMAID